MVKKDALWRPFSMVGSKSRRGCFDVNAAHETPRPQARFPSPSGRRIG